MPNIEPYKTPIPDVDEIENLHDFYIYKKEKVEEKDTIKISITKSKFLRLLKRAGFYKLYIDGLNASIVNISDNKMVTVSKDMITDIVHSYIRTLPVRSITVSTGKDQQMTEDVTPQKIIDALVDSTKSLVDKDTFLHISTIDESELLRDDEGVKYFYFNNTVVKVAKGAKPELMPYDTLTKKVWQSNIINRDYTPSDRKGYFEQFFEKITGMDDTRKKSLMSMMGYLLHNFLETDLFAIWITDVNPDFAERAGRTGKGLLVKAMQQMCNRNPKKDQILCSIKGDKIDFSNEKRYSKVDVSTQLIAIEDLKERAKPDDLITDVTEGIDVRKMYSDVFRHFVKFYISTNFAPNFNNDSVKGRAKIFELANFFSAKLRPSEYFTYPNGAPVWFFGKNFTEKDWNEFYTFMINCADEYIQNGIIEAQDINFTERSLLQLTNEDFLYFIGEKFADNVENKTMGTFKKVPFNPATVFDNELFGQYMLKYDNTLAFTKDKSSFFWRWVREYCNKKSINYCEKKSVSEFYIYPDALTSQQCKMQKEKYKSKKTE